MQGDLLCFKKLFSYHSHNIFESFLSYICIESISTCMSKDGNECWTFRIHFILYIIPRLNMYSFMMLWRSWSHVARQRYLPPTSVLQWNDWTLLTPPPTSLDFRNSLRQVAHQRNTSLVWTSQLSTLQYTGHNNYSVVITYHLKCMSYSCSLFYWSVLNLI